KENKRLKSKKDKEKLKRFKRDIFDESIPVSQTICKYFNTVKDINTKYTPAYNNSTCHTVSEEVSKAAQEEPALRSRGDASVQIVVQGEEASLQRELRIRNNGGGERYDNAVQRHESPRQPDQE
ncbi:MAG: hypothetical protein ACKPKO_27565, partial [Candidatus Fonsibacter sp.]